MKKLLCLLLALGLVFSTVRTYADDEEGINPSSDRVGVKTYTFVKDRSTHVGNDTSSAANTTGDDRPLCRAVPTGTISTNDRIVGVVLTATSPAKGAILALYDLPTVATANTAEGLTVHDVAEQAAAASNLIVEVEVGDGTRDTAQLWWPYPKKVSTQLALIIGQANAAATIFYIDVSDIRG
jgi:hypothetical protein